MSTCWFFLFVVLFVLGSIALLYGWRITMRKVLAIAAIGGSALKSTFKVLWYLGLFIAFVWSLVTSPVITLLCLILWAVLNCDKSSTF